MRLAYALTATDMRMRENVITLRIPKSYYIIITGESSTTLKIRECDLHYVANLPIKTYFMDDQRRSVNKTVLLSTLIICLKFS